MAQPARKVDPAVFNAVNPIVSVTAYKNGGIVVNRESKLQSRRLPEKRDIIEGFSTRSRTRLALVARETNIKFLSLITLTYGLNFPHSGIEAKKDLRRFLDYMARSFGKFDYLWFFEFQARGAPHTHIATNLDPPTPEDREIMSQIWVDAVQGLCDWEYQKLSGRKLYTVREVSYRFHKRPKAWEAIRAKDGLARYAVKYALKPTQKIPPFWFGKVGRFWGTTRRVGNIKGTEIKMDEKTLRQLIEQKRPDVNKSEILPKILFDCFT